MRQSKTTRCPIIHDSKSRMAASNGNHSSGRWNGKTNGVAGAKSQGNDVKGSNAVKKCGFLDLLTHMINDALKSNTSGAMELICSQCDIIFECKICRGLFRDFGQFSRHKSSMCPAKASDSHTNGQSPNEAELNLNKESILALHGQYTTARANRVAEVTESYERPEKSLLNYYNQKRTSRALKEVQGTAMTNSSNLADSPLKTELKLSNSLTNCYVCNKTISTKGNLRRHLLEKHKIPISEIEKLIPRVRARKTNQASQSTNNNASANEENLSHSSRISDAKDDNLSTHSVNIPKSRKKVNFSDALLQTVSLNHPAIRTQEHDYFKVKFSTNFNIYKTKHASISKTRKISAKIMSVALRDHFL